MMKAGALALSLTALLAFSCAGDETRFVQNGPRDSLNLSGDWSLSLSDSLDLSKLPDGLDWNKKEFVPSKNGASKILVDAFGLDNNIGYSPFSIDRFLDKDKKTLVKKAAESGWFKREFDLSESALNSGKVPFLRLGGVAYRMALWVNGKRVGDSVQCLVPLEFNLRGLLKPGKNELIIAATSRDGIIDFEKKTYIAANSGVAPGVRGPVQIEFVPQVAIDDLFVVTSVKKKRIDFEASIVNRGDAELEVSPRVLLKAQEGAKETLKEIVGPSLKIPAGETVVAKFGADWLAPRLWDLNNPVLYDAEAQLLVKGRIEDEFTQGFGFREFELKGRDILLNGKKVVLFRKLCCSGRGSEDGRRDKNNKVFGGNSMRGVYGMDSEEHINEADRLGYLVIPEFGWHNRAPYPLNATDKWLPNVLEGYVRYIKYLRNHPSVAMWGVTNETYWLETKPEQMAVAKEIVETVAKADPTRAMQGDGEGDWGGLLPVINFHYVEGSNEFKKLYPNAGMAVPDGLALPYDEKSGEFVVNWGGDIKRIKWNRPLILGEMWCIHESSDNGRSSYMGDSMYDWEKWSRQQLKGDSAVRQSREEGDLCYEALFKLCVQQRAAGVAGLNPLTADISECLAPVQVAPLDYAPNAFSGGKLVRKIVCFDDSRGVEGHYAPDLQCYLTVDGETVWEKTMPVSGDRQFFTLEIPMPEVSKPTPGKLTLRLRYMAGNNWHDSWRHVETINIIPAFDLSGLAGKLAVFDPKGSLSKFVADLKLEKSLVKSVDAASLEGKRGLIIGRDAFNPSMTKTLESFVEKGGVAALLPQAGWKPFNPDLPERDMQHAATQAWFRAPGHPLLDGMSESEFSYWLPDNIVSAGTFNKLNGGRFTSVLDCGGLFGMCWSPLTTVGFGKGEYVMTTLPLDRVEEPAALHLLSNVAKYAASRQPEAGLQLNLLAGSNKILRDALKQIGASTVDGIGSAGPVLVDGSAELSESDVKLLSDALASGRSVWLHGFTPDSLKKVKRLFPFAPGLQAAPKEILGAVVRAGSDPLGAGLSNFDFKWCELGLGPASGTNAFYKDAKSTAKLGDWVLKSEGPKYSKALTAPAFLVDVPAGKGRILFDTLAWEKAIEVEADKAGRIASSLATNLGCDLKLKPEPSFDFFFVDIKPWVNRGYYDNVLEGKRGWHSCGVSDMRFFLTNHTKRAGGRDDAPIVPVEPFPTKVKFGSVQYQLVDPDANDGKAVVVFKGEGHGDGLPTGIGPIPVGRKADRLWFLHSAAYCGKPLDLVAEYLVEYEDGSKEIVPVRDSMEIADWFFAKPLPKAALACTCKTLDGHVVGVHSMPWENPHPEKTIKSVTVNADKSSAQLILLGISGGVLAERPAGTSKTLADWNFKDCKDGKISSDGSVLSFGKIPPVQEADGLLFSKGACLEGFAKLAGGEGSPFQLDAEFAPDEKLDTIWGGVFQGCGIRLFVVRRGEGSKNFKAQVEIYMDGGSKHMQSRCDLEPGRQVQASVKLDGEKAVLFINGKIEASMPCKNLLPKDKTAPVCVGALSGISSGYSGRVERISLLALED